jgi:hypothetical protein
MRNVKITSNERINELLENECIQIKVLSKNETIIEEDLTHSEMFEIGLDFGKKMEKEFWEKPESFHLPEKYAKLLQQAKDEYQKDSYIKFSSLKIGSVLENKMCEISFGPTQAIHMFGLISRYGKMCAAAQKETV